MKLDMPTLLLMLALTAAVLAFTMWIGTRGSSGGGINKWNAGLVLIAVAWTLMLGRAVLPYVLTVMVANALLLAGVCVQIGALLELDARQAPAWLWLVPPPVLFFALWFALGDFRLMTLVNAAAYLPAFVVSAWICLRRPSAIRVILASMFALGAMSVGLRALAIVLDPKTYPNLFASGMAQTSLFMLLFLMTLVNPFAFLIMQRERAESELRHAAMFDGLTEIFNRRAFIELAERELTRMRRSGEMFALLMLDLDDFKRVNDRYGHQAGDRVLVDFATRAQACIRAADTLGRYGGEEFCVLLPGASLGDATAVAQRIRVAVQQHPLGKLAALPVTVSVGVAACPAPLGMRLDDVIACADEALYRAKAAGKNCVVACELLPPKRSVPALAPDNASQAVVGQAVGLDGGH
jgi:diguanylate cyclase (GGDEF)-like protein